jgi:hypothetical protein
MALDGTVITLAKTHPAPFEHQRDANVFMLTSHDTRLSTLFLQDSAVFGGSSMSPVRRQQHEALFGFVLAPVLRVAEALTMAGTS